MMNAGLLERRDIQDALLPVPPQPGQPAELQPRYDAAVAKCREAMAWYASHRKSRRVRGRHVGTARALDGSGNHARVAMGLPPGQYRIRLEAEKDGGPYSPGDVVLIEPDATTTYTFKVA